MRVHVLFHDNCFDGAASAATFTRFYRTCIDPQATFTYQGLTHKKGSSYDPSPFTDADVHACVDFRYSPSEKLTWWFDHHQSAFEQPEHAEHFEQEKSERKFIDTTAKSCTKFIARVTSEKFGFDPSPMQELIDWAEIIDGAQFPDAHTAVALEAPAMKLMLLAEATKYPQLLPRIIADLAVRPLSEVMASDYVQQPLKPLFEQHLKTIEGVRSRASLDRGVVTFDVSDLGIESFNKFIAYELFPEAVYTVAVSRTATRAKVSVGSSPWRQELRTHNIAKICESYGGGGHPAVGAISLGVDQVPEAQRIAAEVAATLKGG